MKVIIRRCPFYTVHYLSLAFQWNKIKIICAKFERLWHSIEKLTTKEFNNNYKQTSNLTKFQSFALDKRNEKIYRKPNRTLLKRLQKGLIHKQNRKSIMTSAQEVSQHWHISASWCFRSLRLHLKYKCKRPRLGGVPNLHATGPYEKI